MKRDTITINKNMIPYTFDILLADDLFNIRIDYNMTADLFIVTLTKDEETICIEPIIYGQRLFKDLYQPKKFPAIDIIPLDESGQENKITFDNLCNTVLLIVDNDENSIE